MTRKKMDNLLKFLFLLALCSGGSSEDQTKSDLMTVNTNVEESGNPPEPDHDTKIIHNAEFDEEDLDVFQPTSSWQVVLPGQAIPAGLHVRMNLQTGLKEAKLLDGDNGSKYQQVEKPKTKFIKVDKNWLSKQHLQAALKDFRDKFHDENLETGTSSDGSSSEDVKDFRTLDEIKRELEGSEIFVKKDIEMIMEHIRMLNSSKSSLEELQHALDELEYYVHHIDNARDLDTEGGLALLIKFMNSSEESLRWRAAHTVGSAVQSNTPVQNSALKNGALPLVLRLLSSQEPMSVRRKAMYALSALVRLFPQGQREFLQLNGLEILIRLFHEPGTGPLRVKAVTLLTDLLVEQKNFAKEQLEKQGKDVTETELINVPLLKAMVNQGWCQMVASILSETSDNDIREKVLQALDVMCAACKEELVKEDIHKTLHKLRTEWQRDVSKELSEGNDYTAVLSQLLNNVLNKLS